MFRTGWLIFRKTVVYTAMVRYGTFYRNQCKQSGRYKIVLERTFVPTGHLPEDEPSYAKHVEGIKKLKY